MPSIPARSAGRPPGVRVDSALLKRYRERAGLTRDALSEIVGATARTLARAESEGLIGLPLLKQICQVLRLPVLAVLRQDPETIRASLRASGFGPGLPPELIGRDGELTALKALLDPGGHPNASVIVVLEGPIGVGKTSLAQRLSHDLAARFEDGVVWVRGDFGDVRLTQFEIARALGFDSQLPPMGTTSTGRDWRQSFGVHFWTPRRLLVLDDVTDQAQVRAFVPDEQRVTILATTRFRHIADAVATHPLTVAALSDESVVELLSVGLDRNVLEGDRSSLGRLLALIGGMPGVAHFAHAALRRERLTTPASLLERFDVAAARPARDRLQEGLLHYYDSLERQLSATAWGLFVALGSFGSEPTPLSWGAAAAGVSPDWAQAAASELLDANIVNLYQAPDDAEPEPWLRLATHPATAARGLLGARWDTARTRVALHLLAELRFARARSVPDLVRYVRRHQSLLREIRRGLVEGLGPPLDLAAITDPLAVDAPAIDPERADLLIDLIGAISPLLFDHSVADSGEWLAFGLAAARSTSDLTRRGRVYEFCGWWRAINVQFVPQPRFRDAACDAFRRAGRPDACMAVHLELTIIELVIGPTTEAALRLARLQPDIDAFSSAEVRHAGVLCSHTRTVFMLSDAEPAREAAALSRRAWEEERVAPDPDLHLLAVLRANEQAFLRVAGDPNQRALARAVEDLCALQPEPWLKAALLAHAACLGAPIGHTSSAEALTDARRTLFENTRDCPPEYAPRLLWFVATCGLYELERRATGGRGLMVRGGLAGHGAPSIGTSSPLLELCGSDLVLMLSTEATGALLDLEYIDLALELADHVTSGRVVSPALRGLRELLAAEAATVAR